MTKDEKEISELKSDILDIQRTLKFINQRLDEQAVYIENHGHVDQKITGPAVFLQDLYERKIKEAQAKAGAPPPATETPPEKKVE